MSKKYPHPREFYVGLLNRKRHVHINGVTYKRVEDLPADLVNEASVPQPVRLRPPPPPPVAPDPPVIVKTPVVEVPKVNPPKPASQPPQPAKPSVLTANKPKPK